MPKSDFIQLLSDAASTGNAGDVVRLIDAMDPSLLQTAVHMAMSDAAAEGQLECLEILCQHHDFSKTNSLAMENAVARGQADCLRFLIPYHKDCDPCIFEDVMTRAIKSNQILCVEMLLGVCDVNFEEGYYLRIACIYNNIDIVKLVLPYCDPKVKGSLPLQFACEANNQELFDLLYPLSNPHEALAGLLASEHNPDTTLLQQSLAREEAQIIQSNIFLKSTQIQHKKKI